MVQNVHTPKVHTPNVHTPKMFYKQKRGTDMVQNVHTLDFRMTFQEHTNAHEHTPHTNACTSIKNS